MKVNELVTTGFRVGSFLYKASILSRGARVRPCSQMCLKPSASHQAHQSQADHQTMD